MIHRHSDYMLWAKTQGRAKFNLATSGVGPFPLRDLPVTIDQLEINGDSAYGYPPLQRAIAKKCGVDPDCVVALDPAEVRRVITPKTKLIVLTNLHNPSSVLASDSVLREIGDLARSVGARVLVDEVYLDAVYTDTPKTSYHLGPEFIVTTSLTKVYGLSGLRCGWILAKPDLARAMWRLNDLFASIPAHPAELLSVVALENLNQIRERGRRIVEADRALLREFLIRQEGVSAPRTEFGTTAILCLAKDNVDNFLARLRTEHETSAVPGHFFGLPNHFRVGMGVHTGMFREGLQRMSRALATV